MAANNLVVLFIFSFFSVFALGSGTMSISTLSSRSSGRLGAFSSVLHNLNVSVLLICTNGLILASSMVISCDGLSVPDNLLSVLQAVAR